MRRIRRIDPSDPGSASGRPSGRDASSSSDGTYSSYESDKSSCDEDDCGRVGLLDMTAFSAVPSTHNLSARELKAYDEVLDPKFDSQQTGRFLLPLFTSHPEETSADSQFETKKRDIFKVLAENCYGSSFGSIISDSITLDGECSDKCFVSRVVLDMQNLTRFFGLESESSNEDLETYRDILSSIVDQLEPVEDEFRFPKTSTCAVKDCSLCDEFSKCHESNSSEILYINKVPDLTREILENMEECILSSHCDRTYEDSFSNDCCELSFLADDGVCPVNKCHDKWQNLQHNLIKYILMPSDSESVDCQKPPLHVPQVLYDCDSVNTHERFIYDYENYCPGGCGNSTPCKIYSNLCQNNIKSQNSFQSPHLDQNDKKSSIFEEIFLFNDMQAAWDELKILILWIYWVLERKLGDFSQLALGFQVPCNCCYCVHTNRRIKPDVLKNIHFNEQNILMSRCTCRKKKNSLLKGRCRTKSKLKGDFIMKEFVKCSYCHKDSKPAANIVDVKMTQNHQNKSLFINHCCCQNVCSKLNTSRHISPVAIYSKDVSISPIYVELFVGEEVSQSIFESKVDKSAISFYNISCEHWLENTSKYDKEIESNTTCERCRCNCGFPKFYSFPQVIKRMTSLIDNSARVNKPFLRHKLECLYSALCTRYCTRLHILLNSQCEVTFLKELSRMACILRDGAVLLMGVLGPTRLNLAPLFTILPTVNFLIHADWADSAAFYMFLKLCHMLANETLPPEWKDILISYVDVLPFMYDMELNPFLKDQSEKNGPFRGNTQGDDVYLEKMYKHFNLIQEKFDDEGNEMIDIMYKKYNLKNSAIAVEDHMNKYCANIKIEIELLKTEVDTITDKYYSGWEEFEKLIIFAMFKSCATGNCIDHEYLNCQIQEALKNFSFNFYKNYNEHLTVTRSGIIDLKKLLDSIEYCNIYLISDEVKKSFYEFLIKKFSPIDLREDGIKKIAKAFYFNHPKLCRNKIIKLLTDPDTKKETKESFMSTHSHESKSDADESYEETQTDNIPHTWKLTNSPDITGSLHNPHQTNLFKKEFQEIYQIFKKQDDLQNSDVNAINYENDFLEDVDIPETFTYEDSEECNYLDGTECMAKKETCQISNWIKDVLKCKEENKRRILNGYCADHGKKNDEFFSTMKSNVCEEKYIECECHSNNKEDFIYKVGNQHSIEVDCDNDTLSADENISKKNITNRQTLDINLKKYELNPQMVCLKSLDPLIGKENNSQYCKFVENIYSKLTNIPNRNKSLIDCIEYIFSKEDLNKFQDDFRYLFLKLKSYNYKFRVKNSIDFYQSIDHHWDPRIEEIKEEVIKIDFKGKTKDDFEKILHITCFKLVFLNMLKEFKSHENNKPQDESKINKEPLLQAMISNNNSFCVEDYWTKLHAVFKDWRRIAIEIYHRDHKYNIEKKKKIGTRIKAEKLFSDICFRDLGKISMKLSNLTEDPIKVLADKKIVPSNIPTNIDYKSLVDSNHIGNFSADTWIQAMNELYQIEEQLKSAVTKPLTPSTASFLSFIQHNDLTKERELFDCRRLTKLDKKTESLIQTDHSSDFSVKKKTPYEKKPIASKLPPFENYDNVLIAHRNNTLNELNVPNDCDVPIDPSNEDIKSNNSINIKSSVLQDVPSANVSADENGFQKMCDLKHHDVRIEKVESDDNFPVDIVENFCIYSDSEKRSSHQLKIANKDTDLIQEKKDPAEKYGCGGNENIDENNKCPLHPELDTTGHLLSGENPCSCCYCTVFGHAPPLTTTASRNFNETRERLRTILNKKKLNNKSSSPEPRLSLADADITDNKKKGVILSELKTSSLITKNPLVKPVLLEKDRQKDELLDNKTNPVNDILKKPSQEITNKKKDTIDAKDTTSLTYLKSFENLKSDEMDTKNKRNIKIIIRKRQHELKKPQLRNSGNTLKPLNQNENSSKDISQSIVDKTIPKTQNHMEKIRSTQNGSTNCNSVNSAELKGFQSDTIINSSSNSVNIMKKSTMKINEVSSNIPVKPAIKTPDIKHPLPNPTLIENCGTSSTTASMPSITSRDSSYCTSSICSGCSAEPKTNKEDTRDVNMLVKFIEEPLKGGDREKKQAKKARQKNKKLKMKLLKERDVLHEDLVSMVGETSRLREEVVRLEQGLASACRRFPPASKCKKGGKTDMSNDVEEHECALLLRQAACEASARATEAAVLAENAHSRLRHVESALNLLSTSVNRAYLRQQKFEQSELGQNKKKNQQAISQTHLNLYSSGNDNNQHTECSSKNEGMVTIKRVILPFSEEPGVTITPKGSNQLIYKSHEQNLNIHSVDREPFVKQQIPNKKPVLSWESTIAQINALAQTSKKPKDIQITVKKNDYSKNLKLSQSSNSTLTTKPSENITSKKHKIGKSVDEIQATTSTISKSAIEDTIKDKKKKLSNSSNKLNQSCEDIKKSKEPFKKNDKNRVDSELLITDKSKRKNENSLKIDDKNMKTKKSVTNKNTNKNINSQSITVSGENTVSKSAKSPNINNNSKSEKNIKNINNKCTKDKELIENEKHIKSDNNLGKDSILKSSKTKEQITAKKDRKNIALQSSTTTSQASQKNIKLRADSQSPQLHIVNSLSSSMDKIRLNEDTTIELASSSKKDTSLECNDPLSHGNKGAPVSSSIMEQLRSGVQFADLRLPPGITLTRVDPAKQSNSVSKPNIPLMTSATPAAYRPTPPAPPPPAVIMVDTTKLHADRESKSQTAVGRNEAKKITKSKKSRKKSKKVSDTQQSQYTDSKISSINQPEEPPKMVTLRNPMFHPTIASTGVPTVQSTNKCISDINISDSMPMPPNASCQATITPTSNGMYTIRNPLMSIVHQQSMMGINPLETVTNPLLLMANQHLRGSSPQSYNNLSDEQIAQNITGETNDNLNNSMTDLANKLTTFSLEKNKEIDQSSKTGLKDLNYSIFKQASDNFASSTIRANEKVAIDNLSKTIKNNREISQSVEKNNSNSQNPVVISNNTRDLFERSPYSIVPERPCPNPIGTPFIQNHITDNPAGENTFTQPGTVQPLLQNLYTPFGSTDADKSFRSMLFQPYVRNDQDNENLWANKRELKTCSENDLPHFFHGVGSSKGSIDQNGTSDQQVETCQSVGNMNNGLPENIIPDLQKPFIKVQQAGTTNSLLYQHHTYENPDIPSYAKNWNNVSLDNDYVNQTQASVSSLQQKLSHSSSSSCTLSSSSSVYDSNSNSNSPPDSGNSNTFIPSSEYPYKSLHHHNIFKSRAHLYNQQVPLGQNDTDCERLYASNNKENSNGPCKYSDVKSLRNIDSPWNDKFNNTFGIIGATSKNYDTHCKEDISLTTIPTTHGAIGSQRLINGSVNEQEYFTDSSSVFAPDQSITNLNELDSSERDIESFKRFDFYFEPPKNKPKISLNVQDITLQRPSPQKGSKSREK